MTKTTYTIALEGEQTPYTLKEDEHESVTLFFEDQLQIVENRIVRFHDLPLGLDFIAHFLNGLASLNEAFNWHREMKLESALDCLDVTYSIVR